MGFGVMGQLWTQWERPLKVELIQCFAGCVKTNVEQVK